MADESNEQKPESGIDLSGLGSFDFTPAWAKGKPDDASRYARFEGREDRPPRRDGERPRREGGRDGERPRREVGAAPRQGTRREGERPRRDGERMRFGGPRREFVAPLDADVRILPAPKDIGVIINKIKSTHLAYPLKQLAYFFLDHPEACILRVSPRKPKNGEQPADLNFRQCKACGAVMFSDGDIASHVLSTHLSDYYVAEEVTCDPPKGAFACVAKCGLTGELLGPPNLHGYDAKIRDMLRTRFPGMSEQAYRARIEMVRDSDAIEQWRASATKKMVYRKKGEPDAPSADREAAEAEFMRMIAPSLVSSPKSVDITADVALKSTSKPLLFACRDAIQREKRFPASLFYALRGAFHHRKLEFFRANDPRGQEFVTAAKPTALDTSHAIAELTAIVQYVDAHPGTTAPQILAALGGEDVSKTADVRSHLAWLAEKGYVVAYVNGTYSSPAEHPVYRQPSGAKVSKPEAVAAPKPEAVAAPKPEVVEVPKAEVAAEEPNAEETKKEEVKQDETAAELAE